MTEVIAVDGPSGVGKTSVSRGVARRLAMGHLDTGAFYRAAAMVALVSRVDLHTEAHVLSAVSGATFDYDEGVMTLEGIDISSAIRSEHITQSASRIAVYPSVRNVLVRCQREWVARRGGRAVVEGRDIGTVVFPDALLKVYLSARPEVRAGRRAGETPSGSASAIQEHLTERDNVDSTRAASPLIAAEDAVTLDTSDLSEAEVIARVLELATQRGFGAG